ncbi:MAG: UMP kinase [Acholeplasmatales bacterium]|jgi:uridylate kinase|nr:UMP kinase [Acholeplasmatales bacterium]
MPYRRIVLKLSGEALKGSTNYGIDPLTIKAVAKDIKEIYDLGIEIIIIVGAGNIWRGVTASKLGMDRSQADYMGMIGTILNGLALQDGLEGLNIPTRVLSAINVNQVCEPYIRRKALSHLSKKRVIIIVGGTGNPYFSTDSAATLRASELDADLILMAKNGVDGVYDRDPRINKDAKLLKEVSYQEILEKKIEIMDMTAVSMAKDNHLVIKVFSMNKQGLIKKALLDDKVGTLIKE